MIGIYYIDTDKVEITTPFRWLYGAKLVGTKDVIAPIDLNVAKFFVELGYSSKGEALLFMVLERRKVKDFFRTDLYYFSYNKQFIDKLAEHSQIVKMKGSEIAWKLLRLFANNSELIGLRLDEFKKLRENERSLLDGSSIENPEIMKTWSRVLYEYGNPEPEVYISAKYTAEPTNFEALLTKDWTGYFVFIFDFNDQSHLFKVRMSSLYKDKVEWKRLYDEYKRDKEYTNMSILFFPETHPEDVLSLFSSLSFLPIRVNRNPKDLALGQWLRKRDVDFQFLLKTDDVRNYILVSLTKNKIPTKVLLYGKNRFMDYVSYNPFEENINPHVVVVAPSGAGKSFFAQNYVSTYLNLNVEKLIKREVDETAEKEYRVRYFDKGFSAELFFKLLKLRGFDVEFFNPNLEEFVYNVCEFEDELDLELNVMLVNSILSILNLGALTGDEHIFFINTLKEVKESEEMYYYANQKIKVLEQIIEKGELRAKALYKEIKEWAEKQGIDRDRLERMTLLELSEHFPQVRHPTIHDVIRKLRTKKGESVESLIHKLETIMNIPLFSFYTQVKIEGSRIFYMDVENLETSRFFVPLMIVIIKRLFKYDKYKKDEKTYSKFIFDEAHLYFRVKEFADVLNTLIREARRFRIQIELLTQSIDDIPPKLLQTVGTKMFLLPADENERKAILSRLKEHLGVSDEEIKEVVEVVWKKLGKYQLGVWSNEGVFTISMPVDDYKKQLFDSYRKSLELPTGEVIKKSSYEV